MPCFENNCNNANSTANSTKNEGLGIGPANLTALSSFATVTIPKFEYEELLRISERVNIVRRYLDENRFICDKELRTFLNFPIVPESDPEEEEK